MVHSKDFQTHVVTYHLLDAVDSFKIRMCFPGGMLTYITFRSHGKATRNCLEFLSVNVTSTWKPFQKLSPLMTCSFCQMTASKTEMFHVDSCIVCEFPNHKTINTLREELLSDKRIDFHGTEKEK